MGAERAIWGFFGVFFKKNEITSKKKQQNSKKIKKNY